MTVGNSLAPDRARRPRVLFITHTVFHYRREFHEAVRRMLAREDIEYDVAYGRPDSSEARKGDSVDLSFGRKIRNIYLHLHRAKPPLVLQPVLRAALKADLVIVIQENRLLINYLLQLLPSFGTRRLALFGHGRNFQSRDPNGLAERWKRLWATKCDWWFAYTDETRRHITSLGFSDERITVFNNAVDTAALRATADGLTDADVAAAGAALGMRGGNVAVFVGGLYPDKRVDFLVAAADRVRQRVPDFELVVIGGGVDQPKLEALAASRPWLFVAGPRFGRDKVALMRSARLFLLPGLVGLAVLDAGVLGLPIVTTAFPWHSPEIAYLRDGENCVIVSEWEDVDAYAAAVADLLENEGERARLSATAAASAQAYTIEAMAQRFAEGVRKALAA